MGNDVLERLLVVPTKPRNKLEKELLDPVELDSAIKNPQLRNAVTDYAAQNNYSLVFWQHAPATLIRYSFEDSQLVQKTRQSYGEQPQLPEPRIIGVYPDIK